MADIYRLSDGKPRAAVLLSLGANETGRDDADVVNLGHALARAGYVVTFHWSPTMGLHANIDPAEPEKLVLAFQFLEGRDYVDRERVGLGGFCVGASLAMVAASDPKISDRVHFVNAFGPFFDAESLFLQAASRAVLYEGESTPWEPDSLTLRVMASKLNESLDNSTDADMLTRLYFEDETATRAELAALSPSGRTVNSLLDGVEPHEAGALYSTLPSSFREDLARVSPSNHVDGLRARLLVMHDRDDQVVPIAECRRRWYIHTSGTGRPPLPPNVRHHPHRLLAPFPREECTCVLLKPTFFDTCQRGVGRLRQCVVSQWAQHLPQSKCELCSSPKSTDL